MREMDVVGVRVEMPSNQPIVLLREVTGERYLPIWIGAVEATAIAFAQQGVVPPRPLTHDLIKDLLAATGNDLTEVRITEMKDGIFYAVLVFDSGVEVSARPSDSIALALRARAPIFVNDKLLQPPPRAEEAESPERPARELTEEEKAEQLRRYLEKLNPEDFGKFQI